jgi:DNA-binding transcriptional MerR regulator
MARVAEIAALRELGLSLAQVARVRDGDLKSLEPALAAHQAALEGRVHQLAGAVDKARRLRADLAAVSHRLTCVHGPRVSSHGGLKWLDAIDLAWRPGGAG